MKLYPSLENIPDDYVGFLDIDETHIMHADACMMAFKKLCLKQGVELLYNTKVSSLSKNKVETTDGNTFYADHVVVCCGKYTTETFTENKDVTVWETEYFRLKDSKGLPDIISYRKKGSRIYGSKDLSDRSLYKVGLHEPRNFDKIMKLLKQIMPSKLYNISCHV